MWHGVSSAWGEGHHSSSRGVRCSLDRWARHGRRMHTCSGMEIVCAPDAQHYIVLLEDVTSKVSSVGAMMCHSLGNVSASLERVLCWQREGDVDVDVDGSKASDGVRDSIRSVGSNTESASLSELM
ncbi:hypothetical protein BGY98DRAFT_940759, partial [Russula aff. rugulosa BPL654]